MSGSNGCTYYAWREKVHEDGEEHLVVPRSDPRLYEYPIDFVFPTPTEAVDWVNAWVGDEDDITEVASWLLVKIDETVVTTRPPFFHEVQDDLRSVS